MEPQAASPMTLALYSSGVLALAVAMGCYFWIKARVARAGRRVRFANFGGWQAEFQLLRDYRELAGQQGWSLLPLHALYAAGPLGALLIVVAILTK